MKTMEDVCKYIGSVIEGPAICIETGCVYAIYPENMQDGTTNNLARIVEATRGLLYSLDNRESSIQYSSSLVQMVAPKASVTFLLGESIERMGMLATLLLKSVNVLCLDSEDGNAEHAVKEFLAIKDSLADKHFILVDDIGPPPSPKATDVVDLIKSLGYTWIEVRTPCGLFVAAKGYPLP